MRENRHGLIIASLILAVVAASFHGTVVVIIFIPIFITVVGTVFALF